MAERFAHVVLLGSGVAHLDRAYTYRVPDELSVSIGSVVRVPVRGRPRSGVVTALLGEADVARTQTLKRTLGPGLPAEIVGMCEEISAHWLSSLGEAITAALPRRVAEEEDHVPVRHAAPGRPPDLSWLRSYKGGEALAQAVRSGNAGAFSWRPLAAEARGRAIASLVGETIQRGRGALVLLPEVRTASSVASALGDAFGSAVAWLGSDRSARARYRDWLDLRSEAKLVAVGGRSAVYAPVCNLGLVVVDDEAHVSYKERRTPRIQARAVAKMRAGAQGAVFVAVGTPPSMEACAAVDRGALAAVRPSRAEEVRSRPPVVVVARTSDGASHVPSPRLLSMIRRALSDGHRAVLLTHRSGDAGRRIFDRTVRAVAPRRPARLDARALRSDRAAFEEACREADLIVATPVIAKDIELADVACVAVVEADAALAVPEFRAPEEAFATWWHMARWLRPDGTLALETAQPRHPAIAALARWDPAVLWRAEAARRSELGYPPFALVVRIMSPPERGASVASDVRRAAPEAELLGPVDREGSAVLVVRSREGPALLRALRPITTKWRAEGGDIRVDVDPREVLG